VKDSKLIKWALRHKVLTVLGVIALVYGIAFYNWFYWGKVVDADTGQPIEGAAVVASWGKTAYGFEGPSTRQGILKETLTDDKGKWFIRGPKGDFILAQLISIVVPYTQNPKFTIYKPGYCPYPKQFGIDACDGMRVNKEPYGNIGRGETLVLPKLISRQDRWKAYGIAPDYTDGTLATAKKIEKFKRLMNQERQYLGMGKESWIKELDAIVSDYLVLENIGPYKQAPKSEFMGIEFQSDKRNLREVDITTERFTDEFGETYKSYKTRYHSNSVSPFIVVEVKEYTFSDWTVNHKMQYPFRDKNKERIGLSLPEAQVISIDGTYILSIKGKRYSWSRGNKIIDITCPETDCSEIEPTEIIHAYLQKFPAAQRLPFGWIRDVLGPDQTRRWIHDEMSFRLSSANFRFQDVLPKEMAVVVDHLVVFLDFRERYFGIPSEAEKQDLIQCCLPKEEDTAGIHLERRSELAKRIQEYQRWWEKARFIEIKLE